MLSQTGPGPPMGDLLTCSTSMGAFFLFFLAYQSTEVYGGSVWTVTTGNMLDFIA